MYSQFMMHGQKNIKLLHYSSFPLVPRRILTVSAVPLRNYMIEQDN